MANHDCEHKGVIQKMLEFKGVVQGFTIETREAIDALFRDQRATVACVGKIKQSLAKVELDISEKLGEIKLELATMKLKFTLIGAGGAIFVNIILFIINKFY